MWNVDPENLSLKSEKNEDAKVEQVTEDLSIIIKKSRSLAQFSA